MARTRSRRAIRHRRQSHRADPPRTLPRRLEGDRVRGHARRRRQLHNRLQHGKLRPHGSPHRRLHRRRTLADPHRPRIPDAAHLRAQDHPRARHRRWMQRPVRPRSLLVQLHRHRGQPARLPELRTRIKGHRLPHRPRRRQDRRRPDPRRNPELRDRRDHRRLRARPRLLRGQDPALALRQVPAWRPHHRHPDESHRRGHGHRTHLRGSVPESRAIPGNGRSQPALGRRFMARARRVDPHLVADRHPKRHSPLGTHGRAAPWRHCRRAPPTHPHRHLVPRPPGMHPRPRAAAPP